MTFAELIKAFEAHCGVSNELDAAQLALWFNEAQNDLAADLGEIKKQTLTVTAGEEYALPDDCLRLVEVAGAPYDCTPDQKLVFGANGAATLYYCALPAGFSGSAGTQESELHPTLHYLLPIFAAARYWDAESEGDYEESNLGSKWMSYYLQGKAAARIRLDRSFLTPACWQVAK
ncbi:MAG: hypothetical protein Q4B96_06950 [Bacillota bacterium]|nr:hypothetical protein [Bacillota bacterium]